MTHRKVFQLSCRESCLNATGCQGNFIPSNEKVCGVESFCLLPFSALVETHCELKTRTCVCVCVCVCMRMGVCCVCVSVCVDVGLKTQARLPCLWKLSRDTFPFVRCPQMLTMSHKMLFCVLCLWLWCTSWNTMEYIFWFCLVEADYNFWWLDKNRSKKKRLLYFQQAILVAFTDAFHFAHCIKGGLWVIWKGSLSSFTEFKQAYSCISDDFLTL